MRAASRFLRLSFVLALTACGSSQSPQQAPPVVPQILDLTYAFDENTVYWPNNEPFKHNQVAYGRTPTGYWYSSYTFSASEHGGTHLDAPIHFGEGKQAVDQIPIEKLIGPGVKIGVTEKVAQDRDYRISAADIQSWERQMGRIPDGAIVLFETGWGKYWGNRALYLGTEKPNDATALHFPGIGRDAAEFLVNQRQVSIVGIDTPSLDYGPSQDFIAHQILNGANIPGIENVANLGRLPIRGYLILALPMKIAGGSGAPCRVVALLSR